MYPQSSSRSLLRRSSLPFHDDTLAPISAGRITRNIPSLRDHRVLKDFMPLSSRNREEGINLVIPIPVPQNATDYKRDFSADSINSPIMHKVTTIQRVSTIQEVATTQRVLTSQHVPVMRPESPIFAFNPPPIQHVYHESTFKLNHEVNQPIHPKSTLDLPVIKLADPIFHFNHPVHQPGHMHYSFDGLLGYQEAEGELQEAGNYNPQLLGNELDTDSVSQTSNSASCSACGSACDSTLGSASDADDRDSRTSSSHSNHFGCGSACDSISRYNSGVNARDSQTSSSLDCSGCGSACDLTSRYSDVDDPDSQTSSSHSDYSGSDTTSRYDADVDDRDSVDEHINHDIQVLRNVDFSRVSDWRGVGGNNPELTRPGFTMKRTLSDDSSDSSSKKVKLMNEKHS